MKAYTDLKRHAMRHNFQIGERVLLRQKRLRKTMARYSGRTLVVTAVKSSMITVRDEDGATITRDASKFKRRLFDGEGDVRIEAGLGIVPIPDSRATSTGQHPTEDGHAQLPLAPDETARAEVHPQVAGRGRGRPIGSRNGAAYPQAATTAGAGEDRRYPTRERRAPDRLGQ